MMTFISVFLMGLCWGSFLNVVAYRLVSGDRFFTTRSFCPFCKRIIAWYDLVPVVSWLLLRAKCRWCRGLISWLYPFTELVTAVLVVALFSHYYPLLIDFNVKALGAFIAYFLFFSALVIATRTDLHKMIIFQITTLWLIPVGVLASAYGFTKVTLLESVLGILIGYGFLWLVACLYRQIRGKQGIGIGDYELLALIGAFLGPLGVWFALMIGSLSGVVIGALYLFFAGKGRESRIPFGPFLAFGAIIFFFFDRFFIGFFLGI